MIVNKLTSGLSMLFYSARYSVAARTTVPKIYWHKNKNAG